MLKATQSGNAIPQLGVGSRSNRSVLLLGAFVAACLIGLTVAAHAHLGDRGPEVRAFLPIVGTIWCLAEILTAFLLLSQFYVAGKKAFAIVAAGYATSGLMTIPYLGWFPNIFITSHITVADAQVSAWLWIVWHLLFPIAIAYAHIIDPTLDDVTVPRSAIGSTLAAVVGASIGFTATIALIVIFGRHWLPVVIADKGHFTTLYRSWIIPVVVAVNAVSLGVLLIRARKFSPLQMWMAITLLTMTLDGLTNVWAPARYSVVWYVGKYEAVFTSTTVLLALLLEVATLYRRLYDVASIDTLTGLANRRSFNDVLSKALEGREQRASGIALLVLDVDNFKLYNDKYGHAAGDAALAAVAASLGGSMVRANDFVARFGGEEFVIFLPDVMVDEADKIANRVCRRVAKLGILHEGSATKYLTVSIGAAYCSRHQTVSASVLFDAADRALYVAKQAGRNRVELRHLSENERERIAPIAALAPLTKLAVEKG